MKQDLYAASRALHESSPPGKLEVRPTKSLASHDDLSLAYSPGVAGPVLSIAENPDDAYRYTSKGNLVAVISNGSAILGLGNRGALASKPVMEGKAVLFKYFAGVDAFDLELDSSDIDALVSAILMLEPTFGGINLEDIKAPECFIIEKRLTESMKIPVFHDDQHGTAVVACAGLLSALEITEKQMANITVVINGAGAAGIAIAHMLIVLGLNKEQLTLCDTKGTIGDHRTDLNEFKASFARHMQARTLEEALVSADVFIGVSKAGCLTATMLQSMAKKPIVFAMANPDPEINPVDAKNIRPDVIIATGRSDFPNQVNNILCFPFLFRGALDTRATCINDAMKMAACRALADLSREPVPASIIALYGGKPLLFGADYILPKPFDPRLMTRVSMAVADAAMQSGVARVTLNRSTYEKELEERRTRAQAR